MSVDVLGSIVLDLASRETEEEWFEFKENWFDPQVLGEYISAISNAAAMVGRGEGYLIWGVNDQTHEIVGTDFTWRRDVRGEPFEHWLARQTSPDVAFSFQETMVADKRVVVLEIPAAKVVPTEFREVRYFRIGSSKERVGRFPEREARLFDVLTHGVPTVENVPASYQDLTFSGLFTFYAGRGITLREDTFRQNLGLLTDNGRFNLLAQLLSDDSRMAMRVSVFRGRDKASPLHSVREFGFSCLLVALDNIRNYGSVLDLVRADEEGRGLVREDVPLFDEACWHEAVINAFVHNSWVDGNAPMISVFSDRIEILSHGTLPPQQTRDGFLRGVSIPVNWRLSDILLQLHISERSGRGVPKIVSRYGEGAFEFGPNWICVTLPFGRELSPQARESVGGLVLSRTRQAIVDTMRDDPNVTQDELVRAIGVSRATVQNNIAWLREHRLIERVGSSRGGWWRVL